MNRKQVKAKKREKKIKKRANLSKFEQNKDDIDTYEFTNDGMKKALDIFYLGNAVKISKDALKVMEFLFYEYINFYKKRMEQDGLKDVSLELVMMSISKIIDMGLPIPKLEISIKN